MSVLLFSFVFITCKLYLIVVNLTHVYALLYMLLACATPLDKRNCHYNILQIFQNRGCINSSRCSAIFHGHEMYFCACRLSLHNSASSQRAKLSCRLARPVKKFSRTDTHNTTYLFPLYS